MKKCIFTLFLILLMTSACNLPTKPTPDTNQVDTQVANLLTNEPTSTSAPTQQPTQTFTSTLPAEPTATETLLPTLTATATPTATISPSDPALGLGEPGWKNPSDWGGFYFNDQDPEVKITQSDNNLVLTAVRSDSWYGWSLSYIKGTNFYLEGTFKVGDCSGMDNYGLVFRAPDYSNGYFFGISCDGQYSLRQWVSTDFSETNAIAWTTSPDILSGQLAGGF